MMYEELINSLRYCATHACMGEAPALTGCTAIYDDAPKDCDSCNAVLQWQAADAIEELQGKNFLMKKTAEWISKKVPKWIPVTERLPDNIDEEVLVCNEGYGKDGTGFATIAVYNGNGWLECWQRKQYLACITHWMPLPEPPKEE